jgi:U32 family peptidase
MPQAAPAHYALPELLAPAGDWECVRAAVENGADAVYFGLDRFNARMRARNFTEADLPELMAWLHRRGVRGYVTFNTLIFANELEEAESVLRVIIAAGVDAAIVQDVGIVRLIRRLSPDFPIHASTQMTVTSPAGVAFARELGCQLVVMARENSLRDLAAVQSAQRGDGGSPLPLEVFVHGALCVAYSGQCLTSESLGGRSANRGECAQACRMGYQLLCDGKNVELGGRQYLLSPQDLAGVDLLPELVATGVSSLKIEGRLKSPEYVASVTRVYRKALDRLGEKPDAGDRYDLEMAFSRGLHTGWFGGVNNQELVHAEFAKKRGVYLGDVVGSKPDALLVRLQGTLKAGDGVVIDEGRADDHEQGGRVVSVRPTGAFVEVGFLRGQLDSRRIRPGCRLWKTSDPELQKRVRATFAEGKIGRRRPLHFEISGAPGEPLVITARDDQGHVAKGASSMPLGTADRRPLTEASVREQLNRLGDSPFAPGRVSFMVQGDALLPWSEFNRVRREVVAEIEAQRAAPKRWTLAAPASAEARPKAAAVPTGPAQLIPLVRSFEQLEAALRPDTADVYCDFEDPKHFRKAVQLAREARASGRTPALLWAAPPRIFKPGEDWILKIVRTSEADGYLVRNYDHLAFFKSDRRRGDFSLNVANPLSAQYFQERFGLESVTASYDLNVEQMEALLRASDPGRIEVTLHQHMPLFHMEHCVFCAFLSKGTDYTNCGRPCDRHQVILKDRVGQEHPLKADAGCRNTLFNGRAQTGAEFAGRFIESGVRRFRVEFVNETAAETTRVLDRYAALLRGEISGADLWREFNAQRQLGVTRGQLDAPADRKVFPKTAV